VVGGLDGEACARKTRRVESPASVSALAQHGTDVHRVVIGSAVGLAVMVVLSLALGWFIVGRLLRPLRTITATARDISASNLHRRLGLDGRDNEFRELSETLNDLFGQLEASFESQRHFVANASHELRTPLTAERTLLQVALADPDATAQMLRSACQEVLALGEQQERRATPAWPRAWGPTWWTTPCATTCPAARWRSRRPRPAEGRASWSGIPVP
jgi:signal transduction histidine kinase